MTIDSRKYFGIGLGKTGTISLYNAFRLLGFESLHYCTRQQFHDITQYDFATDMPIPYYFRDLDRRFTNAKFIYTVRNIEEWIDSCRRHWNRYTTDPSATPVWERETIGLLGLPSLDSSLPFDILEACFRSAYQRHDQSIKKYFKGRENDLLVLNICDGEGWEKIIPFVDRSRIPKVPFPYNNVDGVIV